jgi:uncharacterized protein YodC (DUF2158 family)
MKKDDIVTLGSDGRKMTVMAPYPGGTVDRWVCAWFEEGKGILKGVFTEAELKLEGAEAALEPVLEPVKAAVEPVLESVKAELPTV